MARKRILLVDDSPTVLMMEKMLLAKGGYDLVTAKDGEEAVSKASRDAPDLILLDAIMPRMNGFETCRALRATALTRDTPIIMVTTRTEMEHVENAYESGCTDYVTKPIDGGELLAKVRSYLGE